MSDSKHFNYEGHVKLNMPEIRIKEMKYLVPILVKYELDGKEMTIVGQADCVQGEYYFDCLYADKLSEKVSEFQKTKSLMHEDTFEAPDEVYEQTDKAQTEYEHLHQQHLGDINA